MRIINVMAVTVAVFVMSAGYSRSEHQSAAVEAVTEAAGAWLDSLDNRRQVAVKFPFDDRERFRWHYFPHSGAGLTLREMTADQQRQARDLIRAVLSADGAVKVEGIMALEEILQQLEGSSPRYRDPLRYAFTLYGQPGQPPWGWRIDGHHLAINVTVASDQDISVTPFFLGSNPAEVPRGPQAGQRIQTDEYMTALKLINSMTDGQKERAILFMHSPGNILSGPGQGDRIKEYEGIGYPDMNDGQRQMLLDLAQAYVGTVRDDIGRPYMQLVKEELIQLHFAWAGGTEEGEAFYYRIHGPRILIEFDNTQNNGNHIHSVWRDPANDFGRDVLGEHYRRAHPLK